MTQEMATLPKHLHRTRERFSVNISMHLQCKASSDGSVQGSRAFLATPAPVGIESPYDIRGREDHWRPITDRKIEAVPNPNLPIPSVAMRYDHTHDRATHLSNSSLTPGVVKLDAAWMFREGVNTEHVFEFLLCVVDITDTLTNLKDADKANGALIAISAARRISIPLRKLLLDGNGHLFKNCFAEPNLHPLTPPSPTDRPVTFVQKFNRPTMELGFADGKRTTVQIPEYEQRTTIHPLYGVRHESGPNFYIRYALQHRRAATKVQGMDEQQGSSD